MDVWPGSSLRWALARNSLSSEEGREGFLEEEAPVAIFHWAKQGSQVEAERPLSTEVETG